MISQPTVGVSAAGGSFGRGVPALLQVCSECGRNIYQTKSFEGIRPTLVLYNSNVFILFALSAQYLKMKCCCLWKTPFRMYVKS